MRIKVVKQCEKIDYDKIKLITKEAIREELNIPAAEESTEKSNENNLQNIICAAIVQAREKENYENALNKEKERKARIKKRIDLFGVADCFDEDGNPKTKTAKLKLVWKFITCKETALKDISILGDTVNSVVSTIFLFIEWILYLLSAVFVLYGIAYPILNFVTTKVFSVSYITIFLTSILYAFVSFLISRVLVRILKIECKYSKDNNYMLNFLAVIIAVIAIIVSVA